MRKLSLLFYFIFLTGFLLANKTGDEGGIKVKVTTSDGMAAAYVTIQIKALKKTGITDEGGIFIFKNIKAGDYEVEISYVGSGKVVNKVTVMPGNSTVINFNIPETASQLAEVVVSSNMKSYIASNPSVSLRLNAPLIEIPQNITVATKQTLTDMGLVTKSEIFRISSAITKNYGSELDLSFQIRGMDATYGTYRNGVGGPIWWNAQEDAAMIERIEFVKGPAGFMLSNAEPGGLINVITKQPVHKLLAEAGFGVGSWGMMRSFLDLGGELSKNGKFTYRLNVGAERKNEYYQFGDFYRYWICPVLKYDFNENTSIVVEHNYVKAAALANSQYSVSINGNLHALPVDLAIVDPNLPKFWGADVYNRVQLKHKFNDHWIFNAQAAYMTTDWDGKTMYPDFLNASKDTLYRALFQSDWDGKLSNLQFFLDGKFKTGKFADHKILIGVDYGYGSESNKSNGTWGSNLYPLALKNPLYYIPKSELILDDANSTTSLVTHQWEALYLQDHIKLFNKLIITIAGRFTRLKTGQNYNSPDDPEYEIKDNKITPRLGLTYMANPNLSAYIIHDESFLAQRGMMFDGGRLPPLTGINNEVGIKALLFQKQLSFTVSLYDMYKNQVATSDFEHPGFFLKTGQIRSTGIDIDIAGKIGNNLYVNINYAYTNPRITKDQDENLIGLQNAGTCKNLANLWLKHQLNAGFLKGLGIGAGWQYADKRSAVPTGVNTIIGNKYLPTYQLFDAAVSYHKGGFSIILNIYNLVNKKYAYGGWWYPEFSDYIFNQGTPRNFRLQTTIRL